MERLLSTSAGREAWQLVQVRDGVAGLAVAERLPAPVLAASCGRGTAGFQAQKNKAARVVVLPCLFAAGCTCRLAPAVPAQRTTLP